MTKKKRKREVNNEFGLYKELVRKSVRDFVDFDYLDKLDDRSREFLAKFSAEYYQSRFKNDGSDLLPQGSPERTKQYADNNARNRDSWNALDRYDPHVAPHHNGSRLDEIEERIIGVIDSEKWDD